MMGLDKKKSDVELNEMEVRVTGLVAHDDGAGAFGDLDDLAERRLVNEVLQGAAAKADHLNRPLIGWRKSRAAAWVGGIAASAAIIVLLGRMNAPPPVESPKVMPLSNMSGMIDDGDGVRVGSETIRSGDALRVGVPIQTGGASARFTLPTGIRWVMEPHSVAEVAQANQSSMVIQVRSGTTWFNIDPKRSGPPISVLTPKGQILVKGTVFVVQVTPNDVHVKLIRGKVQVVLADGREERIDKGFEMRLSRAETVEIGNRDKGRLNTELLGMGWEAAASAIVPKVDSEPLDASKSAPVIPSQKRLLRTIRMERKKRNWTAVAKTYQKLIKTHPLSNNAMVARVSLGELYLSRLGRRQDAIHLFDTYLKSSHTTLAPEALYGKCRALKQLAKTEAEKACLTHFIHRFPNALQTTDAKGRLSAIK